jgi:hypothetical protein
MRREDMAMALVAGTFEALGTRLTASPLRAAERARQRRL